MSYHIYIMTNKPFGTLYIGVTSDIKRRVYEHKNGCLPGFTKKYELNRLVYFEEIATAAQASQREKTMKHYVRQWKINLIQKDNPYWRDLSDDWQPYEVLDPRNKSED